MVVTGKHPLSVSPEKLIDGIGLTVIVTVAETSGVSQPSEAVTVYIVEAEGATV